MSKREHMSLGQAINQTIDERVEREVAGRTGSVEPTSTGARISTGASAPSGDRLVVGEGLAGPQNEEGGKSNPDYIPGSESPGSAAGVSSPEQTIASGQTSSGNPGPPPNPTPKE